MVIATHTVNLERQLDHEADPLADITAAGTVTVGGVPPWNWRDTTGSGNLLDNYFLKIIHLTQYRILVNYKQ